MAANSVDSKKIQVLGVPIAKYTLQETVDLLLTEIVARRQSRLSLFHVITANPEIVMKCQSDVELRTIVHDADLVTADGIGIVLAARWNKTPIQERVTGYDLLISLLDQGERIGLSLYFLGADEHTNRTAVEKIAKKHPGLRIAGRHHGFFTDDEEAQLIEDIRAKQPDLLIVALGAPKAEKWIKRHKDSLNTLAAVGVGGSLDVIAGKVKETPQLWKKLNVEWLHRLLTQPSRWRRQLVLPVFAMKAFWSARLSRSTR
ncbi:WecB/TagA/CpsF family glycosyltransferase [Paenibacillus senegalensis]|uniref:WecB/TagA/CpsF family glycosyltransferase n=1 Tax=Paenibacillus senegalensis TaxID=1465766 RepID=UPI0002883174|nr:WecB/TagA/CpsF family glycosyltransferase [Paenibacillus senegalensis]